MRRRCLKFLLFLYTLAAAEWGIDRHYDWPWSRATNFISYIPFMHKATDVLIYGALPVFFEFLTCVYGFFYEDFFTYLDYA